MMLRFVGAGQDVLIDSRYEPPRPPLRPDLRITGRAPFTRTTGTWIYDSGKADTRLVRFVSSETQGFLTYPQVVAMIALYEAGGNFQIETDLLGAPGAAPIFYAAVWEPGNAPEFTPAVPDGSLYFFDLLARIKEA